MANFLDGNNVKVGPGTLYAAPLGTTEPTDASASTWPSAWVNLGYTDNGSEFDFSPTVQAVEVEEEYWPVRNVVTGLSASLTFALAEQTARNLALSLNIGFSASNLVAAAHGTGTPTVTDVWIEPPNIGSEVRVMLGWDSISTAGAGTQTPFGRLVCRQCFQTGSMKITRQKGNNKATYSCSFTLEKPTSAQPFRAWFPAALTGGLGA